MLASKGEEIVCPQGHVGGSITRDINDGEPITQQELSITIDGNYSLAGHQSLKCGEGITRYQDGRYSVRVRRGWIGG
jgi:hypothetical protein